MTKFKKTVKELLLSIMLNPRQDILMGHFVRICNIKPQMDKVVQMYKKDKVNLGKELLTQTEVK